MRPILYASVGALLVIVVVAVTILNNKSSPSIWHNAFLDQEFSLSSGVSDLDEYKSLEDRLFKQLETEVYAKVTGDEKTSVNRYNKGSKTDPTSWKNNWNRTFEYPVENAPSGVLLLHGMSDSPYSLRSLAEQFRGDGAYVVGLRIPGHGTAPSGLRNTKFEDMAAAVEIAMQYLATKVGSSPVHVVGYSNGAALAVHYTAKAITRPDMPVPAGLMLFSPEIGITPAAALASVQAWLGEWLGLEKLAWNSIGPEYDPYKYGSFAVNAGIQAYRATQLLRGQLDELKKGDLMSQFPPILAFQSAADSTVEAPVLVRELFDKLEGSGHELVIFDVNRVYEAEGLLARPLEIDGLLKGPARNYKVSIVTNKNPKSLATVLQERPAGSVKITYRDLAMKWPVDVYSLAHIALPFPPNDPIYGIGDAGLEQGEGVRLGKLAVHGENGMLAIPISALTRQHWNPFYSLVEEKTRAFVRAEDLRLRGG